MSIDTGGRYSSVDRSNTNPVKNNSAVLFDGSSTSTTSGVINVASNRPVLITAYAIPEGCAFTVEGVSTGSRAISSASGCCDTSSPTSGALVPQGAADILFREPMTLGGHTWQITETTRRILITLPGMYVLQMNDISYIGDCHVEINPLVGVKTELPTAYHAGITSGDN